MSHNYNRFTFYEKSNHTFFINFNRSEDNQTKSSSQFITHVLFIDSTWNQSNGILKDPMLSGCISV